MPQGEDAAQDAQRQQRGGVMQVVLQLGAMYMLYNYAMGGKGKAESEAPPAPAPAPAVEPQPDTPVSAPESSLEGIPAPVNRRNLWSSGQEMVRAGADRPAAAHEAWRRAMALASRVPGAVCAVKPGPRTAGPLHLFFGAGGVLRLWGPLCPRVA